MFVKYVGQQEFYTGYGPEVYKKGELVEQPFIKCGRGETVEVADDFGAQLVTSGHFEVAKKQEASQPKESEAEKAAREAKEKAEKDKNK